MGPAAGEEASLQWTATATRRVEVAVVASHTERARASRVKSDYRLQRCSKMSLLPKKGLKFPLRIN